MTDGGPISHEQMKAIADRIAKTPYNEAEEGPIEFPNYDGAGLWKGSATNFGELPHKVGLPRRERPTMKIGDSALDFVGNTPAISMSRLKAALKLPEGVELIGKAEYYSAGGSVKDRIALRMIEDAERTGQLQAGDVVIEPTSGNTGVGLCMAAAIKGYKVIITMPMKMSGEKLNMMKALGAEIYRTPTEAGWRDTDSHIALALRLKKALGPRAHILDQYQNPNNPLAHYDNTAEEIIEQCGGKIDYVCLTTGTGGTLTGVARKIKEKIPTCQVVGIDPQGSILALPDSLNDDDRLKAYQVEGIGYDFIPTVLDREVVDHWVKTKDEESFKMARSIIKKEGMMIGGSCGSCVAGAVKAIDQLNITSGRVVCMLPDATRNYMSKFLDDDWMKQKGFDCSTF